MDPVIHLSEGHRSDMPLDLSGLTREERVIVQASSSISNASSSNIHVSTSERVKDEGKDGFKRVDNSNTRWFRGKSKGKHTGSGKSGASAHHANLTSVEDYDYDET